MPRSRKSTSARLSSISEVSTEVLRLRLQALNLPFSGPRQQLIRALETATSAAPRSSAGNARTADSGRVTKRRPLRRAGRPAPISTPAEDEHASASEEDPGAASDAASSFDDILEDQADTVFTPAQLSAIQATVHESVQAAISSLSGTDSRVPAAVQPRPQLREGSASPLGLTRPLDRNMQERIVRGEYIDFASLLPDFLAQLHTPELQ